MDVPVLSETPLTFRAHIGGQDGITCCALGESAFLVSSAPDVLQVMVVASEGIVEIVQTFDSLPEKNVFTGSRNKENAELQTFTDTSIVGIGHRATKMLFAKADNLVFILVGGCLRCFGYDPKRSNCFPAMILVDQDVIDFDICLCPQLGLVVAALFEGNLIQTWTVKGGLFLNLSEGELPTEVSDTSFTRIQFVASPVVCAFDDSEMSKSGYSIISVDTLTAIGHITVTPTPNGRLMCTPLFDAMGKANMLSMTSNDRLAMETRYNFLQQSSPSRSTTSSFAFGEEDEDGWGTSVSIHSNKFAILAFNPKQVLEFRLELYKLDPSFGMRHMLMVPLVCVEHPTLLSSIGPWLVVGLPYGIEYYDWQHGDFAQSTLDASAILCSSIGSRVADFSRTNAASIYTHATNDLTFYVHTGEAKRGVGGMLNNTDSSGGEDDEDEDDFNGIASSPVFSAGVIAGSGVSLSLLVTHPIVEVVYDLMENGCFQGLQPTDLMHYGHDIGAEAILVGSGDFASRLSSVIASATSEGGLSRNALFNEYGAMLAKFVHLHPEAGISTCEGCKYCLLCGAQFGLFRRGRRCALCNSPCCDECAPKYDLRDYGFMNIDPEAPIFPCCHDCIEYADQTLYLLMASKRYLQMLQYVSDYPEKTSGFSFEYLLGVALNQCFLDRKYAVCARIVIKYINTPESLQEWIARFGAAKQLHELADVFDPRRNEPAIVTTILMAIMKSDPPKLRALIRKWPCYCYDAAVVTSGIEQQLRKRKAECEVLQEQCETTVQTEDERRAATGLLYIDTDTTQLLIALLQIYGVAEEHTSVVRAYIEHFEQFQMSGDERLQRRRRADAIFVPNDDTDEVAPEDETFVFYSDDDAPSSMMVGSADSPTLLTFEGGDANQNNSTFNNKQHATSIKISGGGSGGGGSSSLVVPQQKLARQQQKHRLRLKQWGTQRCEEAFVSAAEKRRSRQKTSPYDLQPLDICSYIEEHSLYPIALAPYGHSNNFIVMTTMLRLHADAVSAFLATVPPNTCQSLLDVVLSHLAERPKEQLYLLHALTQLNLMLTANYHDKLADLYIDHRPEEFLWFVKQKQVTNVDWRRVLLRVQQRRMYAEMVYVVGRIGNDKDAIRIALRNLKSVHFAMKYVSDGASEDDQNSLWKELMGHVIQSSHLIGECMDHIAEYRNPAEFLSMIPTKNRVVIPNVGDRLGKICREQNVNRAIEESTLDVMRRDNFELFKKNTKLKRRAIKVGGDSAVVGSYRRCGICTQEMSVTESSSVTNAIVFSACGHAFHPECLTARYDVVKQTQPVYISLGELDGQYPSISSIRNQLNQYGADKTATNARKNKQQHVEVRQRTFTMSPAAAMGQDGAEDESEEEKAIRKAARVRAAKRSLATYRVLRDVEGSQDIVQLLPNHLLCWVLSYVPAHTRAVMCRVAEHWKETIDVAKGQLKDFATEAPPDLSTHDLFLKAKYLRQVKCLPTYRNTVTSTTIELGTDLYLPSNQDSALQQSGATCAICEPRFK